MSDTDAQKRAELGDSMTIHCVSTFVSEFSLTCEGKPPKSQHKWFLSSSVSPLYQEINVAITDKTKHTYQPFLQIYLSDIKHL